MSEPSEREGALLAFLLTAADIPILGIGAPFWGLVVGVAANYLLTQQFGQRPSAPATVQSTPAISEKG
ncbi:MAG: benzoate/H(+) symporter BenE family transporter, partial [Chloroflexota bacterium]|nr:benzoate/H(+) symporter BenE family transporter [Chloroflexota bacterium]